MDSHGLLQRFIPPLLAGQRHECRAMLVEALDSGARPRELYRDMVWPAMEHIERMYKEDRINCATEHMATRISRMIADQLQAHLPQAEKIGRSIMIICADDEPVTVRTGTETREGRQDGIRLPADYLLEQDAFVVDTRSYLVRVELDRGTIVSLDVAHRVPDPPERPGWPDASFATEWAKADRWLERCVEGLDVAVDSYTAALMVTSAYRLGRRPSSDGRAALEALRSGDSDPRRAALVTWINGLSDNAVCAIRHGLASELDALESDLSDCLDEFRDPEAETDDAEHLLIGVARRRDFAEGIVDVLGGRGAFDEGLEEALARIDRLGRIALAGTDPETGAILKGAYLTGIKHSTCPR